MYNHHGKYQLLLPIRVKRTTSCKEKNTMVKVGQSMYNHLVLRFKIESNENQELRSPFDTVSSSLVGLRPRYAPFARCS